MVEVETFRGVITGPRRGLKSIRKHQYLARFEGISSKEDAARQLVNRKTMCIIGKRRKILGRIVSTHGKNGTVVIRFRKGLPEPSNGLQIVVFTT